MHTPRRSLLAALLAAVLLLGSCGQAQETGAPEAPPPGPDPAEPADEPAEPDPPESAPDEVTAPADATGRDEVTVWFAREHRSGVWLEPEVVPLEEHTVQVLRAAVEAIVNGQSVNPELVSLVPSGTEILDVAIEAGVALVDLSADVLAAPGGSAQEQAFAQQLAQTATQYDGVDAVRLLVEGEPVSELWGHIDWSEPIGVDPQMLSPIIIASPAWGSTRPPGPVTASGTSVTFESTVELRLVAPDGEVVEDTFTTAAQPDVGQRGPWTHTFDAEVSVPGTWTIEAIEPDPSGGEGRPPFTTSVEFTVS